MDVSREGANCLVVDRHQANGELFESYFGSDERRELIGDFLIRSLYASLRQAVAG